MLRTTKTENGPVQGLIGRDPRITVFRGIPFAAPPIGDLRWRAPRPAQNWDGIRKCYEYGDLPMTTVHPGTGEGVPRGIPNPALADFPMSEDCLYLNIWTPAETTDDKLPVLCFFYGGAMQNGFSYDPTYDGEHLARRGVVVVTVGYRVGLFGFLAHPELTKELQGKEPVTNFGVQDQSAALHWIARNIRNFGGDPDHIVISGQSAGAESVQIQLCSSFNDGLISGGICESSIQFDFDDGDCGITFVDSLENSERYGMEFFRAAGINDLTQARTMDGSQLMRLVGEVGLASPAQPLMFGVSVDGMFLKEPLHSSYYNDRIPDVPMMVGICHDELDQLFPHRPASLAALEAQAQIYGKRKEEFLRLANAHTDADAGAVLNGLGFNPFYSWTRAFCDLRAGSGKRVYFFLFDHDMPGDDSGSCHSSELPFVFDTLDNSWRPFEGRHYDLARQVCSYWANFVKQGDPNGTDINGVDLPLWKPYLCSEKNCMKFSDQPHPDVLPETPILDFRLEFGKDRLRHIR
ncbi:MAG: carboxylesterase/lipase family protein [Fusicatenibacter sp.]|nr:carboxylesterase family protein [Fusicatenibacter sp.]